jgi:hypothetical protein
LRTFSVALPLAIAAGWTIFAEARAGTLRPAGTGAALFLASWFRGSGLLFELADLLLHEPPRLLVEFRADLVVTAVGAALPSFGIGSFTAGAKDGLRERHRRIGAHCTLGAVDESRRKTLQALIALATENSPSACWDDRRAAEILRRETTPEELRELGMEDGMIDFVFEETHDR